MSKASFEDVAIELLTDRGKVNVAELEKKSRQVDLIKESCLYDAISMIGADVEAFLELTH